MPEIRAELDERFRYVLVDEYQDTNRAQYVILRALSTDYPNLAVTGDPDQSIYGWRGADLNNILEFEHDYPEREDRAAGAELSQHEANPADRRRADRPQPAPQEEGAVDGERRRRGGAARALRRSGSRGGGDRRADSERGRRGPAQAERLCDFLSRERAVARAWRRRCGAAGVPYQMVRGQEFYARKEIKDVLAYCQLVNNPRDDMAFERTVNTPPRGIGRKTIERLTEHAYRYGMPLLEAARAACADRRLAEGRRRRRSPRIVEIIDRIAAVVHGDVEEVIGTVLEASGYRASLAESDDEQDQNRLANIEELLTDARSSTSRTRGGGQLEEYLERSWLVNETDDWDTDTDKVTLMTLHAAKGLEFPVVFIVAVEDGVLPHERVGQHPDELEEERRLAFVGITRAKDELQLSLCRDARLPRRAAADDSQLVPDGNAARGDGAGRRGDGLHCAARATRSTTIGTSESTGRMGRGRLVRRDADGMANRRQCRRERGW